MSLNRKRQRTRVNRKTTGDGIIKDQVATARNSQRDPAVFSGFDPKGTAQRRAKSKLARKSRQKNRS